MFDALIIGGGAAGLSCALVLGSAENKPFAKDKKIAIITHQKTSHLQTALFNKEQLATLYPHVKQIEKEKVLEIIKSENGFLVKTNKENYSAKIVVIAVGYTNLFTIKGLGNYIEPHPKAAIEKDRIWLKNTDHLIEENLYVAGTLAGWRSQFAIASGSGAHVATDILTLWNSGKHTKVHDKLI